MEALLTQAFLSSLLFGAVTAGVPLMFAGLGEQISEKAGVLNIGIEGMMLFGAYTGFVAAYYSDSFWLGFLAGGLGGMAVALLMGLLCIRLGLNQIVIGIGLTLGAEGLTALPHYVPFTRPHPRLEPDSGAGTGALQPQPSGLSRGPAGDRARLALQAQPRRPQSGGGGQQARGPRRRRGERACDALLRGAGDRLPDRRRRRL